jgi:hypothetical protein
MTVREFVNMTDNYFFDLKEDISPIVYYNLEGTDRYTMSACDDTIYCGDEPTKLDIYDFCAKKIGGFEPAQDGTFIVYVD